MISEADVHAWSPVVLALEHPQYFYPILLLAFCLAAGLWWFLPHFFAGRSFPRDSKHRQEAESSLRKDISLFYTGSVVVFGVLGAVIQFQANIERDHQQQMAALSAENAKRFDQAVTNLESNSPLANLGAISALTGLMRQNGFYWTSVAELNEFLRQAVSVVPKDATINRVAILNAFLALSTRDEGIWNNRFHEPFPLDFSRLNLGGLLFSQLRLWGSNFRHTNLSGSYLPGASMEGTDFNCANFEKAQLQRSSLSDDTPPTKLGPKLARANFTGAVLDNVQFITDSNKKVDIEDTCFAGASLVGADISGFDLTQVAGLTREQIDKTQFHPAIPPNFEAKSCRPFADLCPSTPSGR
jgi:uncharacterized protein YjbI with pentapeptide repeats